MARPPEDPKALAGLGALRDLLETAQLLVADLGSMTDPLALRLLQIFARVPAQDRTVIIDILEREVERRLLAETFADGTTGIRLRPNPNARLYLRVIDREPELNAEEMLCGTVRAFSMYHKAFQTIREDWVPTALEALRSLDPAARESVGRLARELAALVDQCDAEPGIAVRREVS